MYVIFKLNAKLTQYLHHIYTNKLVDSIEYLEKYISNHKVKKKGPIFFKKLSNHAKIEAGTTLKARVLGCFIDLRFLNAVYIDLLLHQ